MKEKNIIQSTTRKLNWFQRAFYYFLKCPYCLIGKMKRIDWPYTPGWQCPKCHGLVWEKLEGE